MRHAVITAGHKGIGRKVTEQFLQNGCTVTVNFRSDAKRVEQLKEEWKQYNECLQFVQGDIEEKEAIKRVIEQAMERFGRVDYLINNAGPFIAPHKKLADYKESEWDRMISGNLNAVFHFAKLVLPIMRKQHFGRFITYGFQDAEQAPGWMYRSAFAAAKVGLVSLTKTIAIEEAEHGITANMVSPGDIIGEMKEKEIQPVRNIHDGKTPIGRPGTGEDIARIITFLCKENSDLITGSVISASGGVHVVNKYRT
jgi:3-oxoacyl-[acyl-carrier protein] reductase